MKSLSCDVKQSEMRDLSIAEPKLTQSSPPVTELRSNDASPNVRGREARRDQAVRVSGRDRDLVDRADGFACGEAVAGPQDEPFQVRRERCA